MKFREWLEHSKPDMRQWFKSQGYSDYETKKIYSPDIHQVRDMPTKQVQDHPHFSEFNKSLFKILNDWQKNNFLRAVNTDTILMNSVNQFMDENNFDPKNVKAFINNLSDINVKCNPSYPEFIRTLTPLIGKDNLQKFYKATAGKSKIINQFINSNSRSPDNFDTEVVKQFLNSLEQSGIFAADKYITQNAFEKTSAY